MNSLSKLKDKALAVLLAFLLAFTAAAPLSFSMPDEAEASETSLQVKDGLIWTFCVDEYRHVPDPDSTSLSFDSSSFVISLNGSGGDWSSPSIAVDTLECSQGLAGASGEFSASVFVGNLGPGVYKVVASIYEPDSILATLTVVDPNASSITLNAASDVANPVDYDVYEVFTADVSEDGETASDVAWASDEAMNAFGFAYEEYTNELFRMSYAQEAADYIVDNIDAGSTLAGDSFGMALGKNFASNVAPETTIKSDGTPVDVDGPGYYLLVRPDTLTGENTAASSPIFVLVGNGNTTATEKSAIPSVHKFVKENSTGEWGKTADQTVGQKVDIRLVGTLPADLASYKTYSYKFIDNPVGLSGFEGLKVSIDGVEVPSDKYVLAPSFGSFAGIYFDDLLSCGVPVNAASQILVEYSSTLADYYPNGATNTVYVEYSNNPANDGSRGTTVKDKISVLSWTLTLDKVDHAMGAALAGVGFTVKAPDGRYVAQYEDPNFFGEVAPGELPPMVLGLSDTPYTWTTDAAGKIVLEGLDSGSYTIEETAPLADYVPLSAPFTVNISHTDFSEITYDLGETIDDGEIPLALFSSRDYIALNGSSVKVDNVKTLDLPLTGGPGFLALAAVGLCLVGFSVYRIRRNAKEVE